MAKKKLRKAHRVSWYIVHGIPAKNLVTNHICLNRKCVNPDHLEMVTKKENALYGNSISAINSRKIVCKMGHKYDKFYSGQRYCSICESEKSKRLRKKWKENPLLEGV